MPRLFLDPTGTGFDYEHGGYDMFFVGYDASPDPTFKEYYDKDCFPPSKNCYWMEDGPATSGKWTPQAYPNITALWTDIYKEIDPNTRNLMLKEYQQWCYDNVPTVIIRQEQQLWALNNDLNGFDLFHGIQQQICNWTLNGDISVVIAQPGDYVDFNPLLSASYYDSLISSNTHVALARRRGEYNLTHAYPWLAENWTVSADHKTYTVNLRKGNRWSDGTLITAEDVIFTYHTILKKTTPAPSRGTLINILGNEIKEDGTYKSVQKGANNYQVIFTLPEVYVYVETVLFDIPIVQKKQLETINLTGSWWNKWRFNGTNTGSIPMVASGPYVIHNYNKPTLVELWVNPYYNATMMGHDPSAKGGGNWIPMPTIMNVTLKVIKSGIIAATGITNGTYDVIDPQIGIQANIVSINATTNCKVLFSYEWGYQEMGINHYNPIFGMNPKDPREGPHPRSEHFNGLEEYLFSLILSIVILSIGLLSILGLFTTVGRK